MLLYNRDPYQNSRIDVVAQNFLDQLGATDRDFVVIDPYSIGDVYHSMALMPAFRDKYISGGARLIFCCKQRAMPIVGLFGVADVMAEFPSNDFLCEVLATRYRLAPGVPLIMAPDMHVDGWLGRLCAAGFISNVTAKRLILGLDFDCPLQHPVTPDAIRKQAEANAAAAGVEPDKSLIIFNHANTVMPLPLEAFIPLVQAFPGKVFTDTTVSNAALIPGTKPIKIALDHIIPTAEYAGNVVALRSGIVDILSNARVKLVTIYPRMADVQSFFPDKAATIKTVRNFTLAKIGLSAPDFETLVMLDDHDALAEMSARILAATKAAISLS